MPSGVRHHDVELALERAPERRPARGVTCQSVKQHHGTPAGPGAAIVDVDTVRFEDSIEPGRHDVSVPDGVSLNI